MKTWYGVPSPLVTRPGATAYGDPVRTSSMSVLRQGRVDPLVARAAVRAEVGGDVHPVGADLARRLGRPR